MEEHDEEEADAEVKITEEVEEAGEEVTEEVDVNYLEKLFSKLDYNIADS